MGQLTADLRLAVRMLTRSPVVTAIAVLSLAVGIAANTTIFTLVRAVLLDPLGVAEPERVVALFTREARQAALGANMPVSRPNFESIEAATGEVFSGLADVVFVGAGLSSGTGEPVQVGGQLVSASYFEVLGVAPAHGRFFRAEEDAAPGAHPVVVLDHAFWQERFAGSTDVLGTTVRLNGQPFTVVGVAPETFHGTFALGRPDFWSPIAMRTAFFDDRRQEWWESRRALLTFVYARLAPGVSLARAQEALDALGVHLEEEFPAANEDRRFAALPLAEASLGPNQRDGFVRAGGLLSAVVALVLLVACANVANLLLGRAASRRREMAVRVALGAPRGLLIRQLFTESLVLALAAGAVGLVLARWGRSLLWSLRPPFLDDAPIDLSFDPAILLFTLAVSLVTALLFGLAPALAASRPALADQLRQRQGGDATAGAGRVFGLRNGLVMAQVALSLVALVGSGLFLRSLASALEIDLGFRPEGLVRVGVDVSAVGLEPEAGKHFFDRALEVVAALPGVASASWTNQVPLAGGSAIFRTVLVEGRAPDAPDNAVLHPVILVGEGAFRTLGVELIRGRDFSAADREDSVPVAIVDRTMADRMWPDGDALGQRFRFIDEDEVREIVGVVATPKFQGVGEDPQAQLFLPRRQLYEPAMQLVVRTEGDSATVLGGLRAALHELAPDLPLTNVEPVGEAVRQGLWAPRMAAALLGILGLLALLLAAVGIYGVASFLVGQRRREIGIRMALGANRADVVGLVLRQGMAVVGIGVAVGMVVAALVTRSVASLLIGVDPLDLPTFLATAVVLALVALAAHAAPARRATGVDPVVALRAE